MILIETNGIPGNQSQLMLVFPLNSVIVRVLVYFYSPWPTTTHATSI